MAVGGEVVEGLHRTAWPTHAEGVDGVGLTKAEVYRVVVAGKKAGHRVDLSDLFPRLALDLDDRSQPGAIAPGAGQSDDNAVAFMAEVPVDTRRLVDIGHNEVKVAVTVEVAVGGGVAYALVVKAPRFGGLLEL